MIDLKKVEVLEVDGIDMKDYPDFCDAYIAEALIDGKKATDEQLEELMSEHPCWAYEKIVDWIW